MLKKDVREESQHLCFINSTCLSPAVRTSSSLRFFKRLNMLIQQTAVLRPSSVNEFLTSTSQLKHRGAPLQSIICYPVSCWQSRPAHHVSVCACACVCLWESICILLIYTLSLHTEACNHNKHFLAVLGGDRDVNCSSVAIDNTLPSE